MAITSTEPAQLFALGGTLRLILRVVPISTQSMLHSLWESSRVLVDRQAPMLG
jgi:hypothetical protein